MSSPSPAAPGAPFRVRSAVEDLGGGRYGVTFDESWSQGPGVYGGLTAAAMFRAAGLAVGPREAPGWRLRSLALQYLAPVPPGPGEIEVAVEREGSGSAFATIKLRHEGRVHVHALATFGRDRSPDLDEDEIPGPPGSADGLPSAPWLPGMPVFTRHLELRFAEGVPYGGGPRSRTRVWLRFRDPPERLDEAHAIGLLDSPPPAFLARATAVRPASTVSFQLHLLRPVPPDPTAFWCAEVRSDVTVGGWSDEEIRLTAGDGRLVGVGRQLVALLR